MAAANRNKILSVLFFALFTLAANSFTLDNNLEQNTKLSQKDAKVDKSVAVPFPINFNACGVYNWFNVQSVTFSDKPTIFIDASFSIVI